VGPPIRQPTRYGGQRPGANLLKPEEQKTHQGKLGAPPRAVLEEVQPQLSYSVGAVLLRQGGKETLLHPLTAKGQPEPGKAFPASSIDLASEAGAWDPRVVFREAQRRSRAPRTSRPQGCPYSGKGRRGRSRLISSRRGRKLSERKYRPWDNGREED